MTAWAGILVCAGLVCWLTAIPPVTTFSLGLLLALGTCRVLRRRKASAI
jgi:hypothetical protein